MVAAGTVAQIPIDFGHGRSREAGQTKEDDEVIPFHTLLTAGTHRGDRILWRKIMMAVLFRSAPGLMGGSAPAVCSGGATAGSAGGRRVLGKVAAVQEGGAALGGAGRAGLLVAQGEARRWAGPGRAGTRAGGCSVGGAHGRGKSRRRKRRGKGRAGKARTGEKGGRRSWWQRSSRRHDAVLGEARAGVVSSNRGTRRWERGNSKEKGRGFIGARRPEIWQAASRRCIGTGLVPKSGLPTEGEIRLTNGFHNLASK
jgi:hypothetical protein